MKVNNDLQFSKDKLEKLNDSQRTLISSREKEISKLGELYEERKADKKYNGEAELLDIRDRNESEIAEQLTRKQERLSNIKTSFDESKAKLEQEREVLSNNAQEKIKDLNLVYDDKYRETFDRANNLAENINIDTQDTIRRLESENIENISESTFQNKIIADEKSYENERKLSNQEKSYGIQQKSAEQSYERKSAEIMMEHESQLLNQNYKLKSQRKDLENIQTAEMMNMTEQHKDLLVQEDKSFKQKYKDISEQHQSVLERIKNKFSTQVNSLLNSQTKFKANIQNKDDNDFYSITALNPLLENLADSYQISLEVPEYEKENVRLTAQGRDLSLSLTRKFSESVKTEDGSQNKSSRSEIFSKQISTEDLLNSKEVTQSYNEGVLTFNIKKL